MTPDQPLAALAGLLEHRILPPAKKATKTTSAMCGARDPNQKTGVDGFGDEGFILADSVLAYRVDFENLETATAPAQRVFVTDQLASSLAWDTLEFTEAGFGDYRVSIPASSQYYATTVPVDIEGRSFEVDVELSFNAQTGEITVVFQSIEPGTELPPDVFAGLLPPEDGTGRGQGFFSYTVDPLPNLPTGTEIRNIALITFDINEVIATNQVDPFDPLQGTDPTKEALNTIDAGAPTSSVLTLPQQTEDTLFLVQWSGVDDTGGSGLAVYDVFVSDDGGPFQVLLNGTTDTSVTFNAEPGHAYGFYSVATDHVGNRQPTPAAAQATITVGIPNGPPSLTSAAAVSVAENQTSAIDVQATDPDGETENGGGLTYRLSGGADQGLFSINADTGVLVFNSAPDYESPADFGGDNVYNVQVTVTDAGGLTDVQDVAVTVINANEAPEITSSGSASTPENTTFAIDVQATDPDGETENGGGLTYSLTGSADAALFSIDPNTGVLVFNSAPDYENPADVGGDNVYNVEVTATDGGGLTDVQGIAVTVTDASDNAAPSVTSAAVVSVAENQTSVIDVQSTDPDGETENGGGLTYSLTGGADQGLFSIDVDTGLLTFNSAPNYENPVDAGGDNVYDVQVTVTDSAGLTGALHIAVTVTNVDPSTPIDVDFAPNAVPEGAEIGTAVGVTASSSDPQGPAVQFSLTDDAGGRFAIDPHTGVVTVANGLLLEGPATYIIEVRASDGAGGMSTASFNIEVTKVAPQATLAVVNVTEAGGGGQVSVELQDVIDPSPSDSHRFSFALAEADLADTFAAGSASYQATFDFPANSVSVLYAQRAGQR